ncbi:TetR family transcriptional regulator [Lutimaribacter sp. EGI FJ00015]|uniref:TetR family transcriptional regulator n=1 Tax=Lutimaribacter degradans TaxID=2945989 RepID=A0ACC5ZVB8_9RHOB|nr:TetR family transcriptional regulator [Lutimaribacter sp. EGI FJ00013]MCM2562279.1 TetR family transcriptional regulator [Lutimaribacter sp. EGI FJ00013]MCO0613434.1 TetR family transcriptional regulator [Lutimaribacter sp. EGI FJ00015]MCO0636408.1 TetR family transcriptional regulator [Lutimaribacter sp. EGI FJ00014]
MNPDKTKQKQRQRAPSARSQARRAAILDAAERVFAVRGFDGATIRDIAAEAGAPVGLVHHHGQGKAALFAQVVARRADELSALRLAALDAIPQPPTLEAVLRAFILPYLDRAATGGPQWLAYARLVAMVSADQGWSDISARHFDPTATQFIDAIARLYPDAPRAMIAQGFVYAVSMMLAHLTAGWRVGALAGADARPGAEALVGFATAGMNALLGDADQARA